jgi:hypothetical protein
VLFAFRTFQRFGLPFWFSFTSDEAFSLLRERRQGISLYAVLKMPYNNCGVELQLTEGNPAAHVCDILSISVGPCDGDAGNLQLANPYLMRPYYEF